MINRLLSKILILRKIKPKVNFYKYVNKGALKVWGYVC